MALLTIADLEVASNSTIAVEDEAYYQWYIDAVTAYLEDVYPNIVSAEDEEIYCDSGDMGLIRLPGLTEITSVALLDRPLGTYQTLSTADYTFDGVDEIYNLYPHQTYRLVVSYGFTTPPPTAVAIATQLVLAGSGLDPDAIGGLKEISVGNVTEKYGVSGSPGDVAQVTLSSIQSEAMAVYGPRNSTWRV